MAQSIYPPILDGRMPATLLQPVVTANKLTISFKMPTITDVTLIQHVQILITQKSNGQSIYNSAWTKDGVIYTTKAAVNLQVNSDFNATMDLRYDWFGTLAAGVEYSLQIRFGNNAITWYAPPAQPTAAQFLNFSAWKINSVATGNFGEWSNSMILYFLSPLTLKLDYLSLADPEPTWNFYYYSAEGEKLATYRMEIWEGTGSGTTADPFNFTKMKYAEPQRDTIGNLYSQTLIAGSNAGYTIVAEKSRRLILERSTVYIRFHFTTEHGYEYLYPSSTDYVTADNPLADYIFTPYLGTTTVFTPYAWIDAFGVQGGVTDGVATDYEEGYIHVRWKNDTAFNLSLGGNITLWKVSSNNPDVPIKIGSYFNSDNVVTIPTKIYPTLEQAQADKDGIFEVAKDVFAEAGSYNLYFFLIQTSPSSRYVYGCYSNVNGVDVQYPPQPWSPIQGFSEYGQHVWYHVKGFEYQYLTTTAAQLKMPYNTKISNFNTNVQENQTLTLGSQFPYIMRSASTKYRSITINTLISMHSDLSFFLLKAVPRPTDTSKIDFYYEDKLILYYEQVYGWDVFWDHRQRGDSRGLEVPISSVEHPSIFEYDGYYQDSAGIQLYGLNLRGPITYYNSTPDGASKNEAVLLTTDFSFENMELERRFREVAMDFLQNGKAKLYRSTQEGNIVIYPMSIQFSPFDDNRMVYNVQMTLTEVGPYVHDTLIELGIMEEKGGLTFKATIT